MTAPTLDVGVAHVIDFGVDLEAEIPCTCGGCPDEVTHFAVYTCKRCGRVQLPLCFAHTALYKRECENAIADPLVGEATIMHLACDAKTDLYTCGLRFVPA